MPLFLIAEHDRAIREHAVRDYPHECCGFLFGRQSGSETKVEAVVPADNTRSDSPRNRFEIGAAELFRADKTARSQGLGVVGFYHSHPDAPARPSGYDRERGWPGYCYVIVSVSGVKSSAAPSPLGAEQFGHGQGAEGSETNSPAQVEAQAMMNWRLDEISGDFVNDPITIFGQ